jgi:hypothetical protein
MAKRGFVKSIQKAASLKKLSATFISLAFLFVISIVLHFVFNKYIVEGNANRFKPSCEGGLEVVLITSNARNIAPHDFIVRNDWQKIQNNYENFNKFPIKFFKDDKASTTKYIKNAILSESNYPMVVIREMSNKGKPPRYITDIKRNQLTYDALNNQISSYCN